MSARVHYIPPIPDRPFYTIDEATALFGISRRTMERRIADGSIRAVRKMGRPLIPAGEIFGETEGPKRRVGRQ